MIDSAVSSRDNVGEAKMVGVYGLVDPRSKRLMYVGKSVDIEKRYASHVGNYDWGNNLDRYRWLNELQREGLKPELMILKEAPLWELDEAERQMIHEYKMRGQADLNKAVGGSCRNASRSLNSTQDEWLELGSLLRRINEDVVAARSLALRIAGKNGYEKLDQVFWRLSKASSYLETALVKVFPEWRK